MRRFLVGTAVAASLFALRMSLLALGTVIRIATSADRPGARR